MSDFLFFLGRFHVLALHLPIGIVIVAVVLDFVARRERYRALAQASPFLWGAAAVSAVVTVALGYLHFAEGGFAGPSGNAHRLLGTITAAVILFGWWLATRPAAPWLKLVIGVLALGLVSATGHYGGNLTHGSTFMLEYAPGFLRPLLGAETKRPRPTSVAAADPYLDVVQPLLYQRCGSCHNGDKREGSFSMASYESTLAGGDTGRAIVPGDVERSELYFRITRPADDENVMPAEGKTPPTKDQIAILKWWIEKGAPHGKTIGEVGTDAAIEPLLAAQLGIGGAAAAETKPSAAVAADQELVGKLFAAGFLVRQVSQSDPRLVVRVNSPGTELDEGALAVLAAAGAQIADLNLQNAALDDDDLTALGDLAGLSELRLSRNQITDRGLATLVRLPKLASLNLYGNAGVTDAGIDALGRIAALRQVYLWQTGVTAAGVAKLRAARPDVAVQLDAAGGIAAVAAGSPAKK
ncbi:MAG: c-type cytochrome domain-containing protein [Gammaproteobacteria bacterium]